MPTKKPRLLLTLTPENHRLLKVLAAKEGLSVSKLINKMVEPGLDAIRHILFATEDPRQADLVFWTERTARRVAYTLEDVSQEARERAESARGHPPPVQRSEDAPRRSEGPPVELAPARASTPRSARAGAGSGKGEKAKKGKHSKGVNRGRRGQ